MSTWVRILFTCGFMVYDMLESIFLDCLSLYQVIDNVMLIKSILALKSNSIKWSQCNNGLKQHTPYSLAVFGGSGKTVKAARVSYYEINCAQTYLAEDRHIKHDQYILASVKCIHEP